MTKRKFDREETTDSLLHLILSNPTAPFREAAVLRAIDQFAAERAPRVKLTIDPAGNRILHVRGARAGARKPTIAFTAHVDHPGFVPDARNCWELLGRVWPAARLVGADICYYRGDGEFAGTGEVVAVDERGGRVFTKLSRDGERPERGDFAMFNFPPLEFDGDRIIGRVCDDLLGAISILITIDETLATNPKCSFIAAFTRAEEVGFVGALAMIEKNNIPRNLPIVGLECSPARGGNAVVGDGAIVRVGDRMSTFDPAITAFLRDCAEELAGEDASFRYQRRLMQGGSCESTAYLLDGRPAGALCLALGNYHNVPDPDPEDITTGVAPEFVSKSDLDGLVQLMARAVAKSVEIRDPWRGSRGVLAKRLKALRGRLGEV